jgi:hypothetical protein
MIAEAYATAIESAEQIIEIIERMTEWGAYLWEF